MQARPNRAYKVIQGPVASTEAKIVDMRGRVAKDYAAGDQDGISALYSTMQVRFPGLAARAPERRGRFMRMLP